MLRRDTEGCNSGCSSNYIFRLVKRTVWVEDQYIAEPEWVSFGNKMLLDSGLLLDGGDGLCDRRSAGREGCHGCNSPLPIHSTHTITLWCQRREHAKTMMPIILTANIKLVAINYLVC